MKSTEKYFIELISHAIFNAQIEKVPALEVDFVALSKIAKIHSLSAIVYTALKQLYTAPELSAISQKEDNNIFSVIQRSAMQEYECDDICAKLKSQNIKFMKLKGVALRDLYPIKEYRTMGDMDFLVEEQSKKDIDKIMLDSGYNCREYLHGAYCKGSMDIEMHTSMDDVKHTSEVVSNLWDYSTSSDGVEYIIEPSTHLFFTIYHAVKHISGLGCGVRMLLDIAILTSSLAESLDWEKLKANLQEAKIFKTATFLYALCERWFGVKNKLNCSVDASALENLSQFVLKGGTFGFNNPDINRSMIATSYAKDYKGKNKFVVAMKFLFPSLTIMKSKYPVLKKCVILLPFCWVVRMFKFVFRRKKPDVFKEISNVDEAKAFYESIGVIGQDL